MIPSRPCESLLAAIDLIISNGIKDKVITADKAVIKCSPLALKSHYGVKFDGSVPIGAGM